LVAVRQTGALAIL